MAAFWDNRKVDLPLGYRYAATYARIRQAEKDDLGLIVSGLPASAAAVFTQNRVQAAPVKLCSRHLAASRGAVGAILVNAGNANCATRTGDAVALACCRSAARLLRLPVAQVLPASTGVIGVELDSKLIVNALPGLVAGLREDCFGRVARAIMTTDLVPKEAFGEVKLRRGSVRIAGMTKGSGMIQPRMATTLGFVLTDAQIPAAMLRRMLRRAVERSYNRLSVDGDTSTNDTLLLLANGASGVRPDPKEMAAVEEQIARVTEDLARSIARDGEGARKLITILVSGAPTADAAVRLARSIANSPLVKTAVAGSDPNWGRILSAAGNAGVAFDPRKADIDMQGLPVCRGGLAARFSEAELKRKLDAPECEIRMALRGNGKGHARFWTCDFTEDYIRINASYRT
ncbi:MAG TPA: bifunctional glutamate N-acetyltransferase/amino-acid acetyltransferase ArgJ [Bryobacteraceae bacterium]|jgi:glutamate N-acetyltransferase/amino-acid N-acetyltransferase|nr:bifunctional glutamate N-acetyltransferase/amino-acid acetyltransferase ArgJ [Bryobacteraceae bacterium]